MPIISYPSAINQNLFSQNKMLDILDRIAEMQFILQDIRYRNSQILRHAARISLSDECDTSPLNLPSLRCIKPF